MDLEQDGTVGSVEVNSACYASAMGEYSSIYRQYIRPVMMYMISN